MLQWVLRCFEVVFGLRLSLAKSSLITIREVPNLDQFTADLECRQGKLPSTYPGLPIGASYKQKEVWIPLVYRIKKRLNGWKARCLSKGGRLTLIKASLACIPIHYLSLLVLPKSVCSELEKIQRDFLWKRGGWEGYAFGRLGEGLYPEGQWRHRDPVLEFYKQGSPLQMVVEIRERT